MCTQAAPQNDSQALTYRKLDIPESQTRILRLLPSDADTIVRAEFVHIDLRSSSDLNYKALYYVWSLLSGDKDVEMILESAPSPLRLKMSSAMSDKKTRQELFGSMPSVSIRKTFRRSSIRSLSWSSEGCTQLRDVLYGKAQIFQHSTTPLQDHCTSNAMEAVRQFPKCSWFRRRWIVQEAVLPSERLVCYGIQSIPALKLFRVAIWMHHKEDYLPLDIQQGHGMLNASYLSLVVDIEQG
ncbi:predicted protein [Botrytis cinerea T4]|uniref:Heterokaryon incompatibility domain-containing protein n=1 Tax=Botryotinia fuckeliana (strain T4) TaxID=999810 RepID=G2Y7U3_BOTF4|nr:predicted protein [Botrytis cinerea T4]